MNQKFPNRSLLYLLIVFIGFSVLFGIDFMGDPRPTEETLVAYNESSYLPTNPTRYDTLVIKEKKEEEKGKKKKKEEEKGKRKGGEGEGEEEKEKEDL